MIFDTLVLIVLMIVAVQMFAAMPNVPDALRIGAFVFIFGLYDPLCTSTLGGTLGHRAMKLRVKRADDRTRNIVLPLAVVRFIIKALLGWISLLTVTGHEKRQALHDMAIGSVVLYRDQLNELN